MDLLESRLIVGGVRLFSLNCNPIIALKKFDHGAFGAVVCSTRRGGSTHMLQPAFHTHAHLNKMNRKMNVADEGAMGELLMKAQVNQQAKVRVCLCFHTQLTRQRNWVDLLIDGAKSQSYSG